RVNGPLSFLNPTSAHFNPNSKLGKHVEPHSAHTQEDEESEVQDKSTKENLPASSVAYKWTSRNNRKGRHTLLVNPAYAQSSAKYTTPAPTASLRGVAQGILRMANTYPIWDISYDVAVLFTLGSVVWVINAFFVFLPLIKPSTEFKNEELTGGGITAFIGATIFEIGSILLLFESINESRTGCFGWAVSQALEDHTLQFHPSGKTCVHHHSNKRNLVGRSTTSSSHSGTTDSDKAWTWWPSTHDFVTHHLHSLGFLASFTQFLAASVFWISGFTALPGILNHLSTGLEAGIYWTPQVLGGSGFILSGLLFMIETQSKWYKPALGTLGWHIGFWNTIGGLGFTLCPAFGYDTHSWAQYQASCSTFWGSWAFLIGSAIQWYESLGKWPVEVDKNI
ncbi:integral membrane protein, partial [Lophium mytilinum]